MKYLYNIAIFMFVLFVQNTSLGQISHTVNFSQNDAQIYSYIGEDSVEYQRITFIQTHSMQELGNPELPEKYIKLIIPSDQDVESIAINSFVQENVVGNYLIYPVQHPVPLEYDIPPFVEPNPAVYTSDSLYPSKCAEYLRDGYFDGGNHIIIVSIYPYQYRPESRKLLFNSSINFTVNFKSGISRAIQVRVRNENNQRIYDQILENLVDNPEMINDYQIKPLRYTTESIPNFYEYVIITSNALKNSFNNFIEWKKRKGIDIGVVTTEEIFANYTGDLISGIYDDAGKVRQYLSDAYQEGTVWALLAGDHTVVPVRYGAGSNGCDWGINSEYRIPADLYFADFNGDWNVDIENPTRYGEPHDDVDDNPEIFVGRLPCSTVQDISYWIEKVLTYETNPGNGDLTYLTNTFWIKGHNIWVDPSAVIPHCPPTLNHTVWNDFNNYTGAQVVAEMSNHYGLLNWHAHGDVFVFTINQNQNVLTKDDYPWDTGPNNGLDNMTNDKYYSTVYSICCGIAAFDDFKFGNSVRSMAEGFTCFFDHRGGPELLGNTRLGWQYSSTDLQKVFYDLLTDGTQDPESGQSYFHLGVSEGVSKEEFYDHYTKLTHNLFGCPETEIWIDTPSEFNDVNIIDNKTSITISTQLTGCNINVQSLDGVTYNQSARNVSSYTFVTSVRPLLMTVTKSQYLPFTAITGGSFATNYTINENLNVMGTLTVLSGVTLTIEPGCKLYFFNETYMNVFGTLNANGTSSSKIVFDALNTGGTWAIQFRGISSSFSELHYVDIKNGSGIQCYDATHVSIENSLIDHCTNGIYIYNSAPNIISNTIQEPSCYGIYGSTLGYDPLIKWNTITKQSNNYQQYQGIYFTDNLAATHICGNDIQGFSTGLYFTGGGQIYFWDHDYITPNPNNRFGNNVIGSTAAYGSYIGGGINDSWGCFNSFVNNTGYDASAHHNGQMNVQYNWWGSDGAQLSTGMGGIINATNPLNYDPWNIPKGNLAVKQKLLNPGEGDDDIIQAISLEREGRIAELINLCKRMIRDNGNTNFAISELIYVKIKHHINNIRDYLDSLAIGNRPFKAKLLYYLAGLSLHEGNYNIARILYNMIINDFPNSREAVDARFEKFFAALNIAENRELAGQLLAELQSLGINDDDFLMRLEMAEYLYNGSSGSHMSKPTSSREEMNAVKEYALYDNFPNPFNPVTTINYQLPENGFVTLKVYDILGKEIAMLVNEQKNLGRYSVNFDASRLASGVYIYQMRANDFVSSKKMLLVK